MTKLSRLLLATAPSLMLTPALVHASPLVSIGDNADLFFNGSSSVRWSSNLFSDEFDEEEDVVYTISPGFELNVGRGLSAVDLSVITRYDIVRYDDNDQFDQELFSLNVFGSYRGSRLDLSVSAGYAEEQTSSGDINQQFAESDNWDFNLDAEYRYSPKFSIGSGFDYELTEYTNLQDEFSDRERIAIPLDIFYELTPKIDLSVGYRYGNTDVDDRTDGAREFEGYDFDTHFFNVGARGQLLPKLSGFVRIGYNYRDSYTTETREGDNVTRFTQGSTGDLGVDLDLTWTATPKLTASLGVSRDFGVSSEGDSTEDTSVDLSVNYSISKFWSASSNVGYTLSEFDNTNTDDDRFDFGLRATYTPSRYWQFAAGYSYRENDSERETASYEQHEFDLTATLRY